MMIKCVVFDMAGTTVDEDNLVYKTLQKAINHFGYPVHLEEVLIHGAGKEKFQAIQDIIDSIYEQVELSIKEEIFDYFKKELSSAYEHFEVKPMPGSNEIFKFLKDRNIFVVLNTGYDRKTAENLLKKLDWKVNGKIDMLVTASDVPNNRPYPDMINKAKESLGLSTSDGIIKIGDSCIDIEEGRNAGCITIGITTGAQTKEQLNWSNPDYIIDELLDLKFIIGK